MFFKDLDRENDEFLRSCFDWDSVPGSSLPSAVVLSLMRELPPPATSNSRREESTTIRFVHDDSVTGTQRQSWTQATSVQNQVLLLPRSPASVI